MKVLVTGGAGFIGSHLVEELVRRGHQVVVLDDLSTGKVGNIERLLKGANAELVRGSVTDLSLVTGLVKDVAYIFHLAALASVPRSIENPRACHEVNLSGTLNVLLAAMEKGVRKVVYSSSSSVYGDAPTLPKREEMAPQPLSPYAVAKLAGEYYCQVFNEVYKLPTVCLRYFNVYGPRQDPNSQYAAAIPSFIQRALAGDPPIVFGDGEQTRDFTFVKDAVAANILATESEASGIFNIGSGQSITINRLVKLVLELTGSQVKPVYRQLRAGDVRHSLADISRSKAFGYEPQYDLRAGLSETIEWFNKSKIPS
jgi:UDP-glucose 4-epimerase